MLDAQTIAARIAYHQIEIDHWREILRNKACKNCEAWVSGGCAKAEGSTPPIEVQRKGCPAWALDYIPF